MGHPWPPSVALAIGDSKNGTIHIAGKGVSNHEVLAKRSARLVDLSWSHAAGPL